MYGLRKLRKVQRVSMWGGNESDKVRGRSGWASVDNERAEALMGYGRQQRMKGLKELQAGVGELGGAATGLDGVKGYGSNGGRESMHDALPAVGVPAGQTKR